jgi:hypothetical protein
MTYFGNITPMNLQLPKFVQLGDSEGHDQAAGRIIARTVGDYPLCRYCDCPKDKTGDPFYSFKHTKRIDILKLRKVGLSKVGLKQRREECREKLKKMSYRCINDGFEFIIWACMERGVHGALLSELLHAIQICMHDRAIESLFGVAGKKAPGKKKTKALEVMETISEPAEDSERESEGELDYEEEELSTVEQINERIMTQLRLRSGIDVAGLSKDFPKFGDTLKHKVLHHSQEDWWEWKGDTVRLSQKGKHFADRAAADLFF